MKISKAHQHFANRLNNPRALDHPEEFLGPNWKDVLNFWFYLETLSPEQLKIVSDRYRKLDYGAWNAAWWAVYDARVAWVAAAAYVAWDATWNDARAAQAAAGLATWELIGSHNILNQNKPLTFFLMFLEL